MLVKEYLYQKKTVLQLKATSAPQKNEMRHCSDPYTAGGVPSSATIPTTVTRAPIGCYCNEYLVHGTKSYQRGQNWKYIQNSRILWSKQPFFSILFYFFKFLPLMNEYHSTTKEIKYNGFQLTLTNSE